MRSAAAEAAPSDAEVSLADPGADPRSTFRLAIAPGPQPPLELAVTTSVVGADVAERAVRARVTPVVGRPRADGAWPVEITVTAEAALVARATGRAYPTGALALEIVEAAEGGAALALAVTSLVDPVPEAPFGAGARWTATRALEEDGRRVTQVTWYEVVERAPALVLRLQREQRTPGEPPLTSDGEVRLFSDRLLPIGRLRVSYEDTVRIGDVRHTVRVESVLEVRAP
ncbi:MAG: hypothetical protein IT376_10535 [Polyangiaceae bacterium]|nr:hypothetical protein [Polyangiaceae bacterium]